uniref:Variant surface glycoprotein 1125.279 n=1 Tax=Trypanosoma brucei TaxID=5691 RepID=A0A1J0R5M6_9TRYP|nr:variant surface glycoprotein 1125.279 [Trypanosoma brucei]
MNQGVVLLGFFLASISVRKTTGALGDAHADVLALCGTWTAALQLAKESVVKADIAEDMTEILNLNMTLAPSEWQQNFKDQGAGNTYEKFKTGKENKLGNTDWTDLWQAWKKTYNEAINTDHQWHKEFKQKGKKPNPSISRGYVAELADAAWALKKQHNSEIPKDQEGAKESLLSDIKAALCSGKLKTKADGSGCEDDAITTTKATTCSDGDGTKEGHSIGMDMMCLCATATPTECLGTPGTEVLGTGNLVSGILAQLQSKCPTLPEAADAIAAAEEALNVLKSRICAQVAADAAGNVLLGKKSTSKHEGTDAACVNYKSYYAQGKQGMESIPWVIKLRSAIKHAKEMRRLTQEKSQQAATIKQLKLKIVAEFAREFKTDDCLAQYKQVMPADDEKQAKNHCSKYDKNKTCTADNKCKWEGKNEADGPCKPKEGEGQTNQGPGAGKEENAEGKMCSEKKSEGECKDGCKWEGETCKDSSILVSKPFSLMVSAFVA